MMSPICLWRASGRLGSDRSRVGDWQQPVDRSGSRGCSGGARRSLPAALEAEQSVGPLLGRLCGEPNDDPSRSARAGEWKPQRQDSPFAPV
jgi:hypothetical protein